MRATWRSWGATLGVTAAVTVVVVCSSLLLADGRAVVGVLAAVGLVGGAAVLSVPVLAVMGVSPNLAFLVALTTYGLQVVVGAALLRAGRPGGPLADVVDSRWLGGSLVALAVAVTAGVVVDQIRGGRAASAAHTPPPSEG